ncbi:hypothetical protein GCM10028786_23380 [Flaviaesturariibacter terrae]
MSVFISIQAGELRYFLSRLKENRNGIHRVLRKANLRGDEARPFSDEEIAAVLAGYSCFENSFRAQGLWHE